MDTLIIRHTLLPMIAVDALLVGIVVLVVALTR